MVRDRLAAAQRGIALAEVVEGAPRVRATRRRASRGTGPRGLRAGGQAKSRAGRAPSRARAGAFTGPFLAPSSLTGAERLRLLDGFETVIEGVFTHLPLKRARYGVRSGAAAAHPAHARSTSRSTTTRSTSSWPTSSPSCAMPTRATPGRQASTARSRRCRSWSRCSGPCERRPMSSPRSARDWTPAFKPGVRAASTGTACRSTAPCVRHADEECRRPARQSARMRRCRA